MSLTLTILGCGSSAGVPRAGGATQAERWGTCDPADPRNRRRRCAVLLTLAGPQGTTRVVIDTGPDFREQMLDAQVPHIDGVVYTHEHADHLHGIDDLRPFAMVQGQRIAVFMDDRTHARAQAGFGYVFESPPGSDYPPILTRHPMRPGKPIEISGAGGTIALSPVPLTHGDITALGFRIHNTVYAPDVNAIPAASWPLLEGLDHLILDALRYRPHVSHFNVEQALAVHQRAKPIKTILTNLHIDLDYETLQQETPQGVEPAYDGMRLVLA